MAWSTIYTNGEIFGKLDFLKNGTEGYECLEATIERVAPNTQDSRFLDYDINSKLGLSTLVLRKELAPIVTQALGVEDVHGQKINAYYKGSLDGFMALK